MLKMIKILGVTFFLVTLVGSVVFASTPKVDGVFGLGQVTDSSFVAVWVPVDAQQVVSGFRFYNNDELAPYPEINAQGATSAWPGNPQGQLTVLSEISSPSLSWGEFAFPQPLSTDGEGIFLYFKLCPGAAYSYEGPGGGSGLGFLKGTGERNTWVTLDGENWNPMSSAYMVAVEPVYSTKKSSLGNDPIFLSVGRSVGAETSMPPGARFVSSLKSFPGFNQQVQSSS